MESTERDVYYYVRSRKPHHVALLEICRHAGGRRRGRYAPEWAKPVVLRMVEKGILQADSTGAYCLKPVPKRDTKGKVWASAEILNTLKKHGKDFGKVITSEGDTEFYEKL
jgi:hypothetical protein